MGTQDPAQHIYLAANDNLSNLILSRSPLSGADVRALDAAVQELQFKTLVAPGRAAASTVLARLLHASSVAELVRIGDETPINLTPTWDSNPFFFNQLRLSRPTSMLNAFRRNAGVMRGNLAASLTLVTLVIVSLLVALVVIVVPARASTRETSGRALLWSSAYFFAIGLAFMFVEISLIQRMSLFLGHPVYGLAIALFGIILFTGIGSLLSERAVHLSKPALIGWPLALAAYLAALPGWLGKVLESTETGSTLERAAVCLSTMLAAGVLMGFMFPTGMRLCERIDARMTPWLWAVNGAAGVLASGMAVLVSIQTSLNQALWIGAAAYALLAIIGAQLLRLGATVDVRQLRQNPTGSPLPSADHTARGAIQEHTPG
jgi:hypothetical protein